jgi:transposase
MERAEATGVTPVRDRRALAASERTIKRRRRFSLEEKRTILKAAGEPGATVSEVSRQYGVGRGVIHNWRRQEALAVLGATVRFTPVAVEPPRRRGGTIEIELGGAVQVRVDGSVDEEALKRVLRALGR